MGSSFRATVFRDEQYPGATVPDVLQYPSYSTEIGPGPIQLQYPSYSTPRLLQYRPDTVPMGCYSCEQVCWLHGVPCHAEG